MKDDETIQEPSRTPLLLLLFRNSRKEEADEEEERVHNRVKNLSQDSFITQNMWVVQVRPLLFLRFCVKGFSRL